MAIRHPVRQSVAVLNGFRSIHACCNGFNAIFISENVTFDMFRPWTASCRGIHSFEVQRCQLIDFMHQGCIFESKS